MIPKNLKLNDEDKKFFHQQSDLYAYWHTGFAFCILLGILLALKLTPHLVTYIICFILSGALGHRISIILHECIHYTFFKSKKTNEWIGKLSAYTIFWTWRYRIIHFHHHGHLGEHDDPDLQNYINYPSNLSYFLSDVLLNFSGIAAAKQFFAQTLKFRSEDKKKNKGFQHGDNRSSKSKKVSNEFLFLLIVQITLAGSFTFLAGNIIYYFIFWIIPLITISKSLAHFRNMAEHVKIRDEDDPELSRLRTIHCSFWEAFFFAPLNFNYHADHHLYPAIPFWQLPAAHNELVKLRSYHDNVEIVHGGYLMFIFKYIIYKSTLPGKKQPFDKTQETV
jgi:fatty acid desaturase